MEKYAAEYLFAEDIVNHIMLHLDKSWICHNKHRIIGTTRYFTSNISFFIEIILKSGFDCLARLLLCRINRHRTRVMYKMILDFRLKGCKNPLELLMNCSLIAGVCGFAYIYGDPEAPGFATDAIADLIIYYEETLQFFNHSWLELDTSASDFLYFEVRQRDVQKRTLKPNKQKN